MREVPREFLAPRENRGFRGYKALPVLLELLEQMVQMAKVLIRLLFPAGILVVKLISTMRLPGLMISAASEFPGLLSAHPPLDGPLPTATICAMEPMTR